MQNRPVLVMDKNNYKGDTLHFEGSVFFRPDFTLDGWFELVRKARATQPHGQILLRTM